MPSQRPPDVVARQQTPGGVSPTTANAAVREPTRYQPARITGTGSRPPKRKRSACKHLPYPQQNIIYVTDHKLSRSV